MRILVAEDEPLICRDYRVILQSRGHDVIVYDNGLSCLAAYESAFTEFSKHPHALEKAPFDVVILDYRMPKKDGLETAREIVKLCPEQRIIFASAYTRDTLKESTRELHQVVELIQKPFDLSYLVEVVEDTNVYNQLRELNDKVKDPNLTDSELAELLKIVQDGLRVAASVRLKDSELAELLEGLKNVRTTFDEAQ